MQHDNAADSSIPKSIFWLLASWVVLLLVALVWGVDNAETTLLDDTRTSLSADGHSVVVDFSGRDARLVGAVDSDEEGDAIVASVDALPGVRRVENELTVVAPPPPVVREPEVVVRLVGDAVSVRGVVPNLETETELIEAAETQFGVGQVVNALVVAEEVEVAPWMGRIKEVFSHVEGLRSGGFSAVAAGFRIEGEVISEAVAVEMLQEITLVLDGTLPVTSDLTIAVLPPPSFSAAGSSMLVALDGVVPNDETIDQISEAAQRLFGGTTIVNGLRVGEVAGPEWLESIDGLLDVVTRLDPWTLDISGGIVTITGLAMDEDLAASVPVLAEEIAGEELTVVTDVQVNPAAVAIQLTNLLASGLTFTPNTAELSEEGIAQLDAAIVILDDNPTAVVIVEGYTDNRGDAAANLKLSQERADAVVAYLVAGDIAPRRLSAIGYGEENPIADNSTAEGRARNRRIVFVIDEGDG